MTRRGIYILAAGCVAVAVAIFGYGIYKSLTKYAISDRFELYVRHSEEYDSVRKRIHASIEHDLTFDIYAAHLNLRDRICPGYYRFEPGDGILSIVRRLCLGDQTPVRMLVRPARSTAILARNIAEFIEAGPEEMEAALRDDAILRNHDLGCDSLFAMLIPNTYEVLWSDSAETIVRRLIHESDAFWNDERMKRLHATGLTRLEATVLASIVNEESARADDRRTIAGVYMNRLRRRMRLQACPTVIYAHQDFSIHRVLKDQLRIDSPYNTYRNYGLPPTPICMPEISSIDAVLNYDHNSYLYFAADSKNPGRTVFSTTFGEHRRNGRKWASKMNDLNIRQ